MLKWLLFGAAMAASLTVGYVITSDNLRKAPVLFMTEGPDCVGTVSGIGVDFGHDLTAIERAWGEPIPADLARVGGVDWYGWAQVCRDDEGWRGEYRDALYRYVGPFEFVTQEGAPAEFDPVRTHYMSHYDRRRGLLLYRIEPEEPPVPYYFMRLAEPDRLEDVFDE